MTLYPLYIDPGTGSAIFSIVIGATAAIYFVARALFLRVKTLVLGGRMVKVSKNYHPYVVYCEGKQYINVFLPVLEEFERRQIELLYLTSVEEDPVFNAGYVYIKPEYIGEGNKAFMRLNFLSAGIMLATTPGLDVYQWKKTKDVKHYSHVLHMIEDATRYEMFGIDYFDSVLLTGEHQVKDIRYLEKIRELSAKQLLPVGCSYLDVYADKIKELPLEESHPFTVLVSPTWGPSGLLTLYGEKLLDPLVRTGWRIIVRPHPQAWKSDSGVIEKLEGRYKGVVNIEWDNNAENIYTLSKSDVMISDFSGIMFDYMFLFSRPVFYADEKVDLRKYDAGYIEGEMWQFEIIREIATELKEDMFDTIGDLIAKTANSEDIKQSMQKVKESAWYYRGEAGKHIVNFMEQTVNAAILN
ncbi:CDP-glycerol glycerophosphotransferase [Spirochaetia bacterium]|nr:CDP-glycerol glycerophosphotransferase [Spirochaetia bacterium]